MQSITALKDYLDARITTLGEQRNYLESQIRQALELGHESELHKFSSQVAALDRTISEIYLILQRIEELFEE